MATTVSRHTWIAAALVAGLIAGILRDAYEICLLWSSAGPAGAAAYLTGFATVLLGSSAAGMRWALAVGTVVSLALGILWAFGYVWSAQRQRQLLARPLISGLVFGAGVYVLTFALLLPAGRFVPMTVYTFGRDIVAYTVFFGVPLAAIVARFARVAA